ncbi:MAG: O-antigen ligase family protein, partial [Verrucomicrobiales bacterium]
LWMNRRGQGFKLFPPGLIYFLIFYLCISLSITQAPVPTYSLMAMWNFGRMFLYYTLIFNVIRSPGDLRALLWAVAITLMIQCLYALKLRYLNGVHQVTGFFDHQNSMASWAYFCGLPMLALGLSRHTRGIDTMIYLAGFASAGMMVVLSISRGALMVFAVGSIAIIAHAALQKLTFKRGLIIATTMVCGSFVLLMSLDNILDRFIGSEDYDKKYNLRTALEEISYEMLKDHPHGVGLNNYNVVNSRPYRKYSSMLERWDERRGYHFPAEYYERNPNTENLYWMFLAETGYLGFAGLVIFFAFSLIVCLRNYHYYKDTVQGSFIIGLTITLVLFYLHSQLERVFTQPVNLMSFMMLVSIVARYDYARRAGRVPFPLKIWQLYQAILDTRREALPTAPEESPSPA